MYKKISMVMFLNLLCFVPLSAMDTSKQPGKTILADSRNFWADFYNQRVKKRDDLSADQGESLVKEVDVKREQQAFEKKILGLHQILDLRQGELSEVKNVRQEVQSVVQEAQALSERLDRLDALIALPFQQVYVRQSAENMQRVNVRSKHDGVLRDSGKENT